LCPPAPPPPGEKRFRLWYVGSSCLDRRTTLPMLPWLMAEIRRRGQRQEPGGALGSGVPAREVLLLLGSPTLRCVPAGPASPGRPAGPGRPGSPAPAVFIFEHKAQHIARFIHNSHDLTYFAYLIKAQLWLAHQMCSSLLSPPCLEHVSDGGLASRFDR
uniref:Uncharacterized protein n=1 Tax=Strix occidentalis caurina TaxID=311401 RepID=A0A8D0FXP7_STROC